MWIDDVSLVALEEVDWKVSTFREELSVTIRDEDFLEGYRFDETWCSGVEAC